MTLTPTERKRWLSIILWLKEIFPAAFPVKVRTCRISNKSWGYTFLIKSPKKHFLIYISNRADRSTRIDTLLHEWAHACSWTYQHDRADFHNAHDETWGVWYSKIYTAFEKQFGDKQNGC